MLKVFLSSKWKDLEQTRPRIVKALADVYGEDVYAANEPWPARYARWRSCCGSNRD